VIETALLLFVYNRPGHTVRTVSALADNKGASSTRLIIFSDGPRGDWDVGQVQAVRKVCQNVQGFKAVEVVERGKNLGLATSIRRGVSEALREVEAVGVVEDDLVTSPFFLNYLFGALTVYQDDARLMSVSAYVPPRLMMPRPRSFSQDVWLGLRNLSFGWGVWKDRWDSVQWDLAEEEGFMDRPDLQEGFAAGGRDLPVMMTRQLCHQTDSWAIHFSYAHYRQQKFSLLPADTYVKPIGYDGSGVHCRPSPVGMLSSLRHAHPAPELPEVPEVNAAMLKASKRYFDRQFRAARLLCRV